MATAPPMDPPSKELEICVIGSSRYPICRLERACGVGSPPPQPLFICSSPLIAPGLRLGCEAFCLGGFAALGLRISLFDFFWPLAMSVPIRGGRPRTRRSASERRWRVNSARRPRGGGPDLFMGMCPIRPLRGPPDQRLRTNSARSTSPLIPG